MDQNLSKIQGPNFKGEFQTDTGKQQESIKNVMDKWIIEFNQNSSLPQSEKLYKLIQMIMKESLINDLAFDKLNYFILNLPPNKFNLLDSVKAESLVYKCDNLAILGLIVKNINPQSSSFKKQVRERLKYTFENLVNINDAFYINKCLNAANQEELDQYAKRLIVIISMILEHSKDLWFFNQIFSVIVKSIFLISNQSCLKSSQIEDIKMIWKNLIASIDFERDIYYWFTLFDIIFEMLYFDTSDYPLVQIYFATHFIIEYIPENYIDSMMEYISNYILKIKPFENPDYTVCVFTQLLRIRPTKNKLRIIYKLCSEMSKSSLYVESLQSVKQNIISKTIVDQLQIVDVFPEMIDLILYFYIGTYQDNLEFADQNIIEKIISKFERRVSWPREKLVQEKENKIMNEFIAWMKHYKDLKKSQIFTTFLEKINLKSSNGCYYAEKEKKYYVWGLDEQEDEENKKVRIGLRNLTNTCYFNSFLQSLYMTQNFREIILSMQKPVSTFQNYLFQPEKISEALRKTFIFLENVKKSVDFAPIIFKHALREPYRSQICQQDAGEFGSQFFEDLEIDLQDKYKQVKDLFFGQTKQVFFCGSCKKSFDGPQEEFLYFPLSFSGSQINSTRLNVQKLLESSTKTEDLKMKCDHCKKDTLCQKVNQFVRLPNHLLILLNRFTFNSGMKDKITNQVDLNLKLEISKKTYKLYSFIVHSGPSADSGHYYTYALDPVSKYWIVYDDSQTSQKSIRSEQDFNYQFTPNETPYILFYTLQK